MRISDWSSDVCSSDLLTVTDHAARFILACEALESVKGAGVIPVFERLFKKRGLPDAIRSDNGVPFASPNGLYNLSHLSVWCLRLGIVIVRIQPGQPQQKGRHERWHFTLKKETTRPHHHNIQHHKHHSHRILTA